MPQGHSGAPSAFVQLMQIVIAGLQSVRRYLDGAIKRVFVRSVTNFVIGDEWFCSVFKLKMGDSSKMV